MLLIDGMYYEFLDTDVMGLLTSEEKAFLKSGRKIQREDDNASDLWQIHTSINEKVSKAFKSGKIDKI